MVNLEVSPDSPEALRQRRFLMVGDKKYIYQQMNLLFSSKFQFSFQHHHFFCFSYLSLSSQDFGSWL